MTYSKLASSQLVATEHKHGQARGPALQLQHPVGNGGQRHDNQIRAKIPLGLHQVGQQRDGLDGFTQPHLVGKDAIQLVVVERNKPFQPLQLVRLLCEWILRQCSLNRIRVSRRIAQQTFRVPCAIICGWVVIRSCTACAERGPKTIRISGNSDFFFISFSLSRALSLSHAHFVSQSLSLSVSLRSYTPWARAAAALTVGAGAEGS